MRLVSRSAWGARPFRCSEPLPKIDTVAVHYTASNADEQADHANCAGRVKAIQNFHLDGRGWCDIAYNFLVCKHGYVFEGRGWGRKSGATGAANSHTIAFCFLGDDTAGRSDPTAQGYAALGELIRRAMELKGPLAVKGHRNFMATACPGDEIMAWIGRKSWQLAPPPVEYEWILRANGKDVYRAKTAGRLVVKIGSRPWALASTLAKSLSDRKLLTGVAASIIKRRKP